MRLTLLNSPGGDIEVLLPGEKKGRDRTVQAFERAAAVPKPSFAAQTMARDRAALRSARWYDTTSLSATEAGAQASTSAGPKDNPEPIDTAPGLSADALAKIVYAKMEGDIVGPKVRGELRRLVSRKANERWIEAQKKRPGNRTAAEYAKFRADIDAGTEAAVKAYARLKLGAPVDVRADIAASLANPINEA